MVLIETTNNTGELDAISINQSINGFECIMCGGTLGQSPMHHYPNESVR